MQKNGRLTNSPSQDFIGDMVDRNQYMARREEPAPQKAKPQNIEITGAPWQLDSLEQFPSIGNALPTQTHHQHPTPIQQVWGQRR